jgi:branched-chain amino acid transport system ATP-binding protein
MAEGIIIAEGTPDDIAANQDVIDAYLGSHTDSDFFDEIEEAQEAPESAHAEEPREP